MLFRSFGLLLGFPVATTLCMLAIVLSGIIAYRLLPVSALPQVDYPTISGPLQLSEAERAAADTTKSKARE